MKLNKYGQLCVVLYFIVGAATAHASDWSLVWSDEFNGAAGLPDSSSWIFDTCPCYNGEKQNYTVNTTNNARIDGIGNLVLEVKKENSGGKAYSSARLLSKGGWLYGRMEIKAKLPNGQYLWPAIWMLPQVEKYGTWPNSGEIDIMENWNRGWDENAIFGTLHTQPYHGGNAKQGRTELNNPLPFQDFHVYAVEWYKDQIRFLVDDHVFYTYYNQQTDFNPAYPFDNPFHLILNIAVEGAATGNEVWTKPTMEIDYVRVYEGPKQGPQISVLDIPGNIQAADFADEQGVLVQGDTTIGRTVGYVDATDWMDYRVNIAESGSYKVTYKYASPDGGTIQMILDGKVLDSAVFSKTGGWSTWNTLSTTVNLAAGPQTLRLYSLTGGYNLESVGFSLMQSSSAASSAQASNISSSSQSSSSSVLTSSSSAATTVSSSSPSTATQSSSGGGSIGWLFNLMLLAMCIGFTKRPLLRL